MTEQVTKAVGGIGMMHKDVDKAGIIPAASAPALLKIRTDALDSMQLADDILP